MAKTVVEAHERVDKIEAHLDKHEAICAERWLETINRIKRMELILITCSMGVIGFLAHIAVNA
jgi:hypothetical protein